jgi:futalosine hydrolase
MADLPRIVVLAAVEEELRPLRGLLAERRLAASVHLIPSGVGKASAAREAALALREHAPALLLQVGCAGAFPGRGLVEGDAVVATEEILGDEGAETPAGFLDLEALGFPVARRDGRPVYNRVPTDQPLPEELEAIARGISGSFRLLSGPMLTVSTATGTDARRDALLARWRPLAESMEGAAAALAALHARCPFIEVRGVSNRVGRRDRTLWQVERACESAARVAALLLGLRFPGAAPSP